MLHTPGEGRILVINDCDSPPDLHILESFNFTQELLAPIAAIHWAQTEDAWTPPDLPLEVEPQEVKGKNTRELVKVKKRKATFDKAKEAREEFLAGGFDGCVLSSSTGVPFWCTMADFAVNYTVSLLLANTNPTRSWNASFRPLLAPPR